MTKKETFKEMETTLARVLNDIYHLHKLTSHLDYDDQVKNGLVEFIDKTHREFGQMQEFVRSQS